MSTTLTPNASVPAPAGAGAPEAGAPMTVQRPLVWLLVILAVGFALRWWLIDTPLSEIEDGIKAFAAEGVKVNITELDVDPLPRGKGGGGADVSATEKQGLDPYPQALPPDLQQRLARRYGDLFKVFAKHHDVVLRVTFWGVDDGSSWLNNWPVRGRTNHPLLWDRQLQPKPALNAVIDAIRDFDKPPAVTR